VPEDESERTKNPRSCSLAFEIPLSFDGLFFCQDLYLHSSVNWSLPSILFQIVKP